MKEYTRAMYVCSRKTGLDVNIHGFYHGLILDLPGLCGLELPPFFIPFGAPGRLPALRRFVVVSIFSPQILNQQEPGHRGPRPSSTVTC